MSNLPIQILEMIKWCGIISCLGFWVIILAHWAYKFFVEDLSNKK